MTVRVAISDPRLLPGLTQRLEACECAVRGLSDRAFEVTTADEGEVAEARMEIAFFLRAWQDAHPGVDLLIG